MPERASFSVGRLRETPRTSTAGRASVMGEPSDGASLPRALPKRRSIYVVADFGRGGDDVVRRADEHAARMGARLIVAHFVDASARLALLFDDRAGDEERWLPIAREALARRVHALTARSDDDVEVRLLRPRRRALADDVARCGADLVVLGDASGDAMARVKELLRRTRVSVLLLRAPRDAAPPAPSPSTVPSTTAPPAAGRASTSTASLASIASWSSGATVASGASGASPPRLPRAARRATLAATDLSDARDPVLRAAVEQARATRGELVFLHCAELANVHALSPSGLATQGLPPWEHVGAAVDAARARLERAARAVGAQDAWLRIGVGDTRSEILQAIERRGVGLVVVGSHRKSALARLFFGSTAEAIFARAPCSVLAVPLSS